MEYFHKTQNNTIETPKMVSIFILKVSEDDLNVKSKR